MKNFEDDFADIFYLLERARLSNEAALKVVKQLMQQGVKLKVTFRYTKDNIEYAWVESQTCEGVKVLITEPLLFWMFMYIFTGNYNQIEESKTDVIDEGILKREDTESIQTPAFISLLAAGKIKVRPSNNCPEGFVVGTYKAHHGEMIFRIKSTPELQEKMKKFNVDF